MYTPGQKFIEFFLNELLHRDNGGNQQFVNSGMETHHISTNLWNIIVVGAMTTDQCLNIDISNFMNNFQWNLKRNSNIFIQ